MKGLLAGLVLCVALTAEGQAEPRGPALSVVEGPEIDVIAALERIRDTGVFPEYLSLDYVELHHAVGEIVERDPQGYVADLASRVLTRVVVNLRRPLLAGGEQPYLEADLLGPPNIGLPDVELQGSIDGGPWKVLNAARQGATGTYHLRQPRQSGMRARLARPGGPRDRQWTTGSRRSAALGRDPRTATPGVRHFQKERA